MFATDLSVSEFVDLVNQTFEVAYPNVNIIGELANFRISKSKWVYFDLKDEFSTLKFFGTVYSLNGPLEDGMLLKVSCSPRVHNVYGFSMQVQHIELVGEGSLRRAAELLQVKLAQEGLFDMDKKRLLPYPPSRVGLITSSQSAAYHDFKNIINNRWRGLDVNLIDVQVQGEAAINQIVSAISYFNRYSEIYEVLVLIRGGGSPEDLAVFNTEEVTRAVATSKAPTLVAVGHEIDISLAELAADKRASTPSHAAELLVPDKRAVLNNLKMNRQYLDKHVTQSINNMQVELQRRLVSLEDLITNKLSTFNRDIKHKKELLKAYNPEKALGRGYAVVRRKGVLVRRASDLEISDILDIKLHIGSVEGEVKDIRRG
ncbi:MAG: exodeoxyribonuclease VII large subunit [Candidatus Saccharimonadales bacterium]